MDNHALAGFRSKLETRTKLAFVNGFYSPSSTFQADVNIIPSGNYSETPLVGRLRSFRSQKLVQTELNRVKPLLSLLLFSKLKKLDLRWPY